MPRLVSGYLEAAGIKGQVMAVHRLDKEVGGLMVFAIGTKSAAELTAQISGRKIEKEYLAVVHGVPDAASGELCDLLYHDQRSNKTYIVDRVRRGVREARLEYRLCGTAGDGEGEGRLSLLRIRLITGRTHQIRAQFSSRKMPLWGDARYGSRVRTGTGERAGKGVIALWSARLAFTDPATGKLVDIKKAPPDGYPWQAFGTGDQIMTNL